MPRGKKELAEQIIPYAASVEIDGGWGKTLHRIIPLRPRHLTNRLGVTQGLSGCTVSTSVPFPEATKVSGCLSAPIYRHALILMLPPACRLVPARISKISNAAINKTSLDAR